jgi:hypothetical protein
MLHQEGRSSSGRSSSSAATLRAPLVVSARQPPWSLKLLIAFAVVLCVTMTKNGPLLPVAEAASLCFTPVKCVCPYGYKVKLSDPCMCVTCEFGECPLGVPQLYASCATIKCPDKRCKKKVTYTCGKMSITCPPA